MTSSFHSFRRIHVVKLATLTLSLAAALALTACPSSGGDQADGGTGGSAGGDVTARQLAEAFVTSVNGCFDGTFGVQVEGSANDFISLNADDIETSINADIANSNIAFDQEAANRCYTFLTDGGDVCGRLLSGAPPAGDCNLITHGILAEGDPCDANECGAGLYCDYSGSTSDCGACHAQAVVGESCSNTDCAEGLQCTNATCEDIPAAVTHSAGDSCTDSPDECGNLFLDGLWCVDGTCAQATTAATGESCSFPFGPVVCEGTFSQSASCVPSNPTDPTAGGTCADTPTLGETCTDSCFGSYCDGTSCVAYAAVGDACTSNECDSDLASCNFDGTTGTCVANGSGDSGNTQCTQ